MKPYPNMSCGCGKRQYLSKADARQAATRSGKAFADDGLAAYKCPTNKRLWHVGHTNPAIPAAVARSSKRAGLAVKLARGDQ